MIPLYSIENNKLTSLKGDVSYFFELTPPDLEQMDAGERLGVLREVERCLMGLEGVLKIYWIKGRIYLNIFGSLDFNVVPLAGAFHPLKTFFYENYGSINYYENYLISGPVYQRILSLDDFPEGLEIGDSTGYPDFVIHVRKYDPLKAKSTLNMKRKLHFSALYKGMRDLDSENAYKEAEELLEDVTRNDRGLFDLEMFFIVSSETKDSLDVKTRELLDYFKLLGGKLQVEERGMSFFHKSCIPGVLPSFKRQLPVPSDVLSYLVPFTRDHVMGDGLEFTTRSGKVAKLALFDFGSPNFNALITGSSGQGKSMLANSILKHELSKCTKGIVLDLGNSFKKNASFHNGSILSEKFNPLQFKNSRYLKEFVLSVVDEKLGKREEGRLFEVIEEYLTGHESLCFHEFLLHLERHFNGISFYFAEIKRFITNEKQPLNDFTYCDFGLYPESMKAPLIIYLIEYFKNLSGRKIFIFDECWHLLSKNADYIAECFRTFRKHDASAIAISQNLDDFCETQLGRVIMQNTYYKFLFKQSLKTSEFVNSHVAEMMEGVHSRKGEYSEFLLLTETIRKPLRFYPSPLEYQLFTSDKRDNLKFENYMSEKGKFLNFDEALINFTKITNPDWRPDEKHS